jgi:hypothetical protein
MKGKEIVKVAGLPVFIASLCCVAPLVLVLLGLSTVSFAASLTDTLYGGHKWIFRGVGLTLLAASLVYYFRKKGVCTFDQAVRRRNEIINMVIVTLIVAIIAYVVWLYGIVHILGVLVNIW